MAKSQLETGVALILFKRPEKIEQVFDRIREARPTRLFMIADGPQPGVDQDARNCEAAREVVRGVDWPCEVRRNYADNNLGLKARIPTGIDWVFEHVDRAIVLEDDCLPHPSFFPYCEQLLERYQDDERILHIAGSQLLHPPPDRRASYHFSRYVHIWGWATWRRAWRHYDVDLTDWHDESEERRSERLRELFSEEPERRYWRHVWDNSRTIDNWDAQWSYSVLSRGALAINPNRNMIRNIGFDVGATFALEDPHGIGDRPLEGTTFPLVHPDAVARDATADARASYIFRLSEPARVASEPPVVQQQRFAPRRLWQVAKDVERRAVARLRRVRDRSAWPL